MRPVDASTVRRMRAQLVGDASLTGRALARRLSQQADAWFDSLTRSLPSGWALMATGGYARGVLCPGSDIDVILIHPHKAAESQRQDIAAGLWYPMWDAGIKLGAAVHSEKSLLQLAGGDLETATAVLRVRHLGGDPAVIRSANEHAVEQWRRKPHPWLDKLLASAHDRWSRFGDVASLLEPDIKDGRGGLRDYDTIRWALAVARDDVTSALEGPIEDLAGPADVLLATRCELHRATGRTANTLLLQEQDRVADVMGFADADALMANVAAAAHTLEWASERFWRRIERLVHGSRGAPRSGTTLGRGVVVDDAEAAISDDADVDDPAYVLHLAATAAHAGLPVGARSLRVLASRGAEPGESWTSRTRQAFLSLLGAGPALVPAVESLERYDLFSRYMPEWRAVRSLPQRNAFHTYTVDRHLLQTVANANELLRQVSRPDLLLCAALLHDIGKGYPGDHTEAGMALVGDITGRMGFSAADTATLRALIEHHLLLSETATRRDLSDPRTIANVATAVGDEDTLELLAALTKADSLATGPSAWSSWKESLIDELVGAARATLGNSDRSVDVPGPMSALIDVADRVAGDGVLVERETDGEFELVRVGATDRRGLFATVAGVLSLHSLDVVGADAYTSEQGIAVDQFRVVAPSFAAHTWQRVGHDIRAALSGELDVDAKLAQRISSQARRRPMAAAPPRRDVLISNDDSDESTMIDVRAPDGPAVLYRLSHALSDASLSIRSAKVVTLGHEVVDVFYVQTEHGGKVPNDAFDTLRHRLLSVLER